jgi:hypothetical protein
MKKINLLIVLALSACATAYAQISIVRSDFGNFGDVIQYHNALNINNVGGWNQTGANATWDLGSLNSTFTDSIELVSPQQIETAPLGANMAVKNIGNIYEYYVLTETAVKIFPSLDILDFGDLPFPIPGLPQRPFLVANLPLSFGAAPTKDSLSFPITFGASVLPIDVPGNPDSIRVNVKVVSTSIVDGSGNLITPNYTAATVRLKNTVSVRLSIQARVSVFGFRTWISVPNNLIPFALPEQDIVSYNWYGKNRRFAVAEAQLDSNGELASFKWQTQPSFFTSVNNLVAFDKYDQLNFYPNPATDNVVFQLNEPVKNIVLYDVTGKNVLIIDNPKEEISVANLPNGIYHAIVNGSVHTKLVVAH